MFSEILYNINNSISTNIVLMKTLRWAKWFVYILMVYILYKHIDNFSTIDIMISSIIIWAGIANIVYLSTIMTIIKELKKTISNLEKDFKPPTDINNEDKLFNEFLNNIKPFTEISIEDASNSELDNRLKEAIKNENFELANKIAIEIEKRKK